VTFEYQIQILYHLCISVLTVDFGEQEDCPIIFIAHSLGGPIAAQALVHGEQRTEKSSAKSITKNLRGMIFLGHRSEVPQQRGQLRLLVESSN
jgi:alpha-beta hydrolase superfamily lysophospholipase